MICTLGSVRSVFLFSKNITHQWQLSQIAEVIRLQLKNCSAPASPHAANKLKLPISATLKMLDAFPVGGNIALISWCEKADVFFLQILIIILEIQ